MIGREIYFIFEHTQILLYITQEQSVTQTNSIKDWIQIFQAFLTPVIAFIAAWIAYQQYQINQSSFNNQVYERRLKVFNSFMSYLANIIKEGETNYQKIIQFYTETSEVDFIFKDPIINKREELYKKGLELIRLHEQLYPSDRSNGLPVGEERSKVAENKRDLLNFFTDQIRETKELFKQQMKLL